MTRRTLSIVLLIPFTLLTLYALYTVGYVGVLSHLLEGPAGWQIFADLAIACLLVLSWIIPEARKAGRNPWPYVVLTFLMGSFGPLLYLVTGKSTRRES